MSDDEAMRAQLVRRIATRRSEVARYVRAVRPWSNRLATISVVSGALVAATTAGPALGSSSFTESVQKTFGLPSDLGVWQVACLVALVVSLVSTVSSAMLRRQDIAARVAAAESAAVELGSLGTAVEFRQIELGDAVARFQQLSATVPFVDEGEPAPMPQPAPYHPNPVSGPLPQPTATQQGTGSWRSYYES